jgi:uncharacterized protein YlxW (UPF0749 family)
VENPAVPDDSDHAAVRAVAAPARTTASSQSTQNKQSKQDLQDAQGVIEQIACGGLDPAYADAASRRAGAPEPAPAARRVGALALRLLALALVGLLVATAALRQAGRAPEQARARAALAADVAATRAETRRQRGRIAELRRETAAARAREVADEAALAEAGTRIARLAPAAGWAAVRGPGVRVRMADPPAGPAAAGEASGQTRPRKAPDPARVRDHDVAELVNVLWAAGAEAVAVGGVRLTAVAAIRSVGTTILVGFRPLDSPYVVEAIGDPARLSGALASSPAVVRLRAALAGAGGGLDASEPRELVLAPAPAGAPRRAGGANP